MTLADILTIDASNAAAWAEHDAQVDALEAKQRAAADQSAYEKLVPPRYWSASFDTYKTGTDPLKVDILNKMRSYAEAVKNGASDPLILLGPAGTGKTHLACSCLRENLNGLYINACEIIDELQRVKSFTSKETEAQRLKRYAEYKLVIIDEVGRGGKTEAEQYALYSVINARYNARRATMLISNKGRDAFLNYIGDAAQDRLIESGHIIEINAQAPSYRAIIRGGQK